MSDYKYAKDKVGMRKCEQAAAELGGKQPDEILQCSPASRPHEDTENFVLRVAAKADCKVQPVQSLAWKTPRNILPQKVLSEK